MKERYLLVKHSEGWNVDRCCRWMEGNEKAFDWFYPLLGQPFPDPQNYTGVIVFGGAPSANDDDEHSLNVVLSKTSDFLAFAWGPKCWRVR